MPSTTYAYTGGWQTFTVPDGVKTIHLVVNGGGSGIRAAGQVSGNLAVVPGGLVLIDVGKAYNSYVGSQGGAAVGAGGGGAGGNGLQDNGGNSGGGYSQVRFNDTTGTIVAVAGGAGGDSGDGGAGGLGGGSIGQQGGLGTAGPNQAVGATGGTQNQGGNGGQSSASAALDGKNASDALVVFAGAGGSSGGLPGPGGGGGGGGYHGGGGGCGGASNYAPATGGGGGSNFTAPMSNATNVQGGGGTGNGSVTVSWSTVTVNPPPTIPSDATPPSGTATKSTGTVVVTALVKDTQAGGASVHLRVDYSTTSNFSTFQTAYGPYINVGSTGATASCTLTGLVQDQQYFCRIYSITSGNVISTGFTSTDFFTNRAPLAPTLNKPNPGESFTTLASVTFDWTPIDPDPASPQAAAQMRWRQDVVGSPYTTRNINGAFHTFIENPGTFKSNTFYLWSARTMDPQQRWGPWADEQRFFSSGTTSPPIPKAPLNSIAVDIAKPITFTWRFMDPDPGDTQYKADIQWRVFGTGDIAWVTTFGDHTTPGQATSWTFPPGNFQGGFQYEWQVRTYDTLSGAANASDWSISGFFWSVDSPGSQGSAVVVPPDAVPLGSLGCGKYRCFIYDRGGKYRIGEVTEFTQLSWDRRRDDISQANIIVNGFDRDCGELLGRTRSMRHELVLYRNGSRVWEGPITRIEYQSDQITMDARDVMHYCYRRIMRQGYDDSYPNITTVIDRATRIYLNAMAPDDPNTIPYFTTLQFPDDAKESRIRADYTSTAWEEIDDMAATAGLDYTVIGRRVLMWDTHRPIGRLPMMRDGDFHDPPIVTEYGNNLATIFGVGNGTGLYGTASADTSELAYYGIVEQLASAYGETATSAATDVTLTPAAKAALIQTLNAQAARNIGGRSPSPLIVHVPDNTTLNPDIPVDINYLVPGVWIPLQAVATVRKISQWQKLDSMSVTVDSSGEKVAVVMSPAPGAGQDPDADSTVLPVP